VQEILLKLLRRLEPIAQQHEEIGDTESRDAMRRAVFRSFLRPEPGYELPDDLGLFDDDANREVKEAIAEYISAARVLAPSLGLTTFQHRLAAFQDCSVVTQDGTTYDDFFGHQIPSYYGPNGEWLPPT
jgi:hypothetical protein